MAAPDLQEDGAAGAGGQSQQEWLMLVISSGKNTVFCHKGHKKTSRKEGKGRQFDTGPQETGARQPVSAAGSAVRYSSLSAQPNCYQAFPHPPSNSLQITAAN